MNKTQSLQEIRDTIDLAEIFIKTESIVHCASQMKRLIKQLSESTSYILKYEILDTSDQSPKIEVINRAISHMQSSTNFARLCLEFIEAQAETIQEAIVPRTDLD